MRSCTSARTTCTIAQSQPRQQIGASNTQSDKSKLYLVGRGSAGGNIKPDVILLHSVTGSRLARRTRSSYYFCARWSLLSPAVMNTNTQTRTNTNTQVIHLHKSYVPVRRIAVQQRYLPDTPALLRSRRGAARTRLKQAYRLPYRVAENKKSEVSDVTEGYSTCQRKEDAHLNP